MANNGWGSKWPMAPIKGWPKNDPENIPLEEVSGVTPELQGIKPAAKATENWLTHTSDVANSPQSGINGWFGFEAPILTGIDLGAGERTILTTFENDGFFKHRIISQTELKSQGSNLVDDQQYLYFQCDGCGEILDPHTKSFAKLQEHRVNAGWACKWNIDGIWGYKVYCSECGEKAR